MAFEPLYSFLEPVKKYKCNTCEKETLLAVTANSNWALKRHINSHHSELISGLLHFDISFLGLLILRNSELQYCLEGILYD